MSLAFDHYRQGNYEAALCATEEIRIRTGTHAEQLESTRKYNYLRGSFLAQLGRIDEAEICLRRNIAILEQSIGKRPWLRGVPEKRLLDNGFSSLGELLLKARRFDEARECFEKSIHHDPEDHLGYLGMADSYLMSSASPAEALRWARLAIAHTQTDEFPEPELRKIHLATSLVTLAWATAVTSGNASEVALWITEAQTIDRAGYVPVAANVQYYAGCAYAELRDSENSLKHFDECARIDTQGYWGREARRMMQSKGQ